MPECSPSNFCTPLEIVKRREIARIEMPDLFARILLYAWQVIWQRQVQESSIREMLTDGQL
jgi:hypothetical protein